jgi:hypothetical protein
MPRGFTVQRLVCEPRGLWRRYVVPCGGPQLYRLPQRRGVPQSLATPRGVPPRYICPRRGRQLHRMPCGERLHIPLAVTHALHGRDVCAGRSVSVAVHHMPSWTLLPHNVERSNPVLCWVFQL